MNDIHALHRFKRKITLAILVLLFVHIAYALSTTFFSFKLVQTYKPFRLYHYFISLGPFFASDKIQTSFHFIVDLKQDNKWFSENLTAQYTRSYFAEPWYYKSITLNRYIRNTAIALHKEKKGGQSEDYIKSAKFRQLHKVIAHELNIKNADSIRWKFLLKWYKPEINQYQTDTLFSVNYSPIEIEQVD